jgi:DNA mismatch repair ATPase MutS
VLRGTIARDLQIVTGAFRQVGPLIAAAATIGALPLPSTALTGRLRGHVSALAGLRRIAGWVSRDRSGAAAGDLGGLVIEYLNLLFFLDANALFFGARELRAHADDLRRVIVAVGEVDTALSVASYRAGTSGWTRPRFGAATDRLHLVEIRHPLLPDAVPNSVTLGPPDGLLITGSNMSGKSTFLRTVGVTIVMAQTIHTCVAERYEGPTVAVRSCIGRADDPASGKSYYLVEVEAVLDLVKAARAPRRHVMLFDELFRGTNAIERISAGAAVLETLVAPERASPTHDNGPTNIVIAATHDLELVDLLAHRYAPYHFTDSLDAAGLVFDYRLRQGASTTRNAIALLELRGAPAELVARALAHAQDLGHSSRMPDGLVQ